MYMRSFAILLIASFIFAPSFALAAKKEKGYATTVSAKELKDTYEDQDLKILIIPGHEPTYGGAVFMGVYEREINVDIANALAKELKKAPGVDEVVVARSGTHWNKGLARYFDKNERKINSFIASHKKAMEKKIAAGAVKRYDESDHVPHATAQTDVAHRLYGLNKWANENDFDLILNLHVNDAPDHGPTTPGANSGFAIYIPDPQFGNGKASRPVAQAVANRLNDLSATSTLRVENKGIVEDQTLIGIGAFNTLEAPVLLIEYGYITESKFLAPQLRKTLTEDLAYQTYLGVLDFFGEKADARSTKTLPRTWNTDIALGTTSADAYALQAALRSITLYPPKESDLTTCPISGTMNECTQVALKAYQKQKGLQETGMLDARTRQALNAQFGK